MNPWYLLCAPFVTSAAFVLWKVVGSWLYGRPGGGLR